MTLFKLPLLTTTLILFSLTAAQFDSGEEINETLICTKDLMEVEIPSQFFLRKNPPVFIWDLHLNDPECRGTEDGNSYVFRIKTNLSDCGTITVLDDSHIMFINSIHNNNSDAVTRSYVNITFVCRYPISYLVQQANGENMISVDIRTITLNTEDGNFSVSMVLYKDENFVDKWTTVPFLKLEDNIFVKVYMEPAHLIIRLERCWATPANNPYHAIQYDLILDSCSESLNDGTLSVILNGQGPAAMFRIQMFKFVGDSFRDVFLHCNVQICHGTAGLCQPNCTNATGLTRRRRDITATHIVSYGPIRRKQIQNGEASQTSGNLPPVETLVLAGLLVLVLIVTGIFGKLWFQSQREYPAMPAQLTLSNIRHHSEVAS
ncbi:uromodulin-like [Protopterus annectens]|uniref:uromodulin-like n=1 Tax=Protopterus annectens TaxID=7888 RepID=UPI001CFB0804|nr:uromodulin-like [Protopterus annectens]